MSSLFLLLAQNDNDFAPGAAAAGGAMGMVCLLLEFALAIVAIAGMWTAFAKAGKPGWAAIIPIYNVVVMCEIAGKPIWWVILFLIPCVNIVIAVLLSLELAKSYGKGAGFGLGLAFLPFIFWPILGFGDARYHGPAPAGMGM
jgi:hypothetical protein